MPMQKVIPDHVDFRLRLPSEVDRALRGASPRQERRD